MGGELGDHRLVRRVMPQHRAAGLSRLQAAVKQPLELVHSYPDVTIVKDGLEPGQLLITQGYSNISEGEKLEIISE